jgi:OOP family OmpA-OmpF porin
MNIRLKPVWIALALATSAAQAAPDNDWYVGVGVAGPLPMTSMTSGRGKDATAINAFVGYNYNENLGAELGYLSTGDWDIAGKDFNSKGPPCRSLAVCR